MPSLADSSTQPIGPLENFSKLLGSDRTLFRLDRRVALYTRLDDVQIGKVESAQLLCENM
jgi:hypothetical protein